MLSIPECSVRDFASKVVSKLSKLCGIGLSGLSKEDQKPEDWDKYGNLLNSTHTESGKHTYPPTKVVTRHLVK